MRRSRYTVSVDGLAGEHILYNSAWGSLAVLNDEEFGCFERCEGEHTQLLAEQGFLTDLTADEELAAQKALFDAQRHDHSELTLVLAPTYACNLRCPYCYELGHNSIKGKMNAEVIDAVVRFAEDWYSHHAFNTLSVQWYGGDPSLALDVVEELSGKLLRLCESLGAAYEAMMLTNCNVIDEPAVEMLSRMQVKSVFMTIDGFEGTHNERRVSAVGLNSFERNIEAARLFVKHGVEVRANMNVDKVNWPEYYPLRDYLRDELGVELTFTRLCDYGHFFGTRDFKRPAFDLLSHQEFCKLMHDAVSQSIDRKQRISALLQPAPRFCKGQRDDYFIIDTRGDVYLCDGYIGEQDHVVGNVVSGDFDRALNRVSHDPYENEQCSACHLLPICQGNCDWERRASNMACHPLLETLPDYLRDWAQAQKGYTKTNV